MNEPNGETNTPEDTATSETAESETTVRCPPGHVWDPASKMCIPILAASAQEPCPEGTHWDPASKQCVPNVPV